MSRIKVPKFTKQIREIINFMGLCGAEMTDKNKKTFRKYLKVHFEMVYKDGSADGLKYAREILFEENKQEIKHVPPSKIPGNKI